MTLREFVHTHEKPLRLIEISAQILILIAVIWLVSEKFFLHYKVVLVEEVSLNEYQVVKEIIVNGKVTDDYRNIDLDIPEHDKAKLIIENSQHTFNSSFIIS